MPSIQSTYAEAPTNAFPGATVDFHGFRDDEPGHIEAGDLDAGTLVQRGTHPDGFIAATDGEYIGVLIRDKSKAGAATDHDLTYSHEEQVTVRKGGYIKVNFTGTGDKDDALLYDDTTLAISAGTAGEGETQLTGWTLAEKMTASGVAKIRIPI